MALFTQTRVIETAQGPITVKAVFDSDTNTVVFTATTANGVTVSYTDDNQFRGINGRDRYALSKELSAQGIELSGSDASRLSLTAATLGRNATAEFRTSINAESAPAESAGQQAAAAAPTGPTAPGQQVVTADGQVTAPPAQTAPTNAVATPTTNAGNGDSGTDAPVRTLEQTQAPTVRSGNTSLPTAPGVGADDNNPPPAAASTQGTDTSDDTYGGASQAEYAALQEATGQGAQPVSSSTTSGETFRITPRPNELDRFSSYTYRASWYLVTPEQYKQLVVSKKKTVNGYMLLMQSGGAPANSGGARGASATPGTNGNNTAVPGAGSADAGRNPFFPQDFYFENITVENLITGNGSRAAHAVSNIKMTVVEPTNITLIDRLYEAVQDFMPASGQKQNINYASVTYLLVIRFYGYDENGNLVTNIGAADKSGRSDPNAVIEKFIPFKISKFDWTVESKGVTYNIEGLAAGLSVGATTRRATIPYDLQLTSKSLGELLGGEIKFTDTTGSVTEAEAVATFDRAQAGVAGAPPNANAAGTPKPTLSQGLMGAMNQWQEQLVKSGQQEYADNYRIVFAGGGPGGGGQAIEKAKLIPPGKIVDKKNLPTAPPPTTDPRSAQMSKLFVDTTSRNYSISAGMQVVQAIDMAIRNSEFIYAQQRKFYNEDNDANTPEEQTQNGSGREVTWYNISIQATPRAGQYDRLRNDFAHDITYVINTFTPYNFYSGYFPLNQFRGLHKTYPYWFTGKNTAVLEYKETLNNLYNLTVSGTPDQNSLRQRQNFTSSMRDQPFYSMQSASAESRQGVSGLENEPGSNLAANLYDPAGLANVKMKIVGDPAWIQQGSFAFGIDPQNFDAGVFLPDGTINFDARQILFEVAWQRPEDYDLGSGLADPYAKSSSRQPIQSRVYTASKVTSMFERGSFTQNLEGLLYFFMKPNATNKAASAPQPIPARQADVRAVDNAITATERAPTSGTRPVPEVATAPGSGNTGVFNAAPPGPKDQVAPATPPVPATSNGEIDINTLPGGEAAGIGIATPAPVASNGQTNATAQAVSAPVPAAGSEITTFGITVGGQEVNFRRPARPGEIVYEPNGPQDIAWEP